MGAAGSEFDQPPAGGAPSQDGGTRPSRHSGILARWERRRLGAQLFCVVRHAERADGVFSFYRGGRWTQTEDFQQWPLDPPLSDAGEEAAVDVADHLRAFAKQNGAVLHVVVTSPYVRCVQTAAAIARKLGRGTRLLVDRSLGEVFGPAVMGEAEPARPTRPAEELREHVVGTTWLPSAVGAWPPWPETLHTARWRYVRRFLTYLQRSERARRNFVLVTHADGVGAALSLMPTQAGRVVQSVDPGGLFMARRTVGPSPRAPHQRRGPAKADRSGGAKEWAETARFASAVPCQAGDSFTSAGDDHDADIQDLEGILKSCSFSSDERPKVQVNTWMLDEPEGAKQQLAPPKSSDGWEVETHNIVLRETPESTTGIGTSFNKRVRKLMKHSSFSQEQIEHLLGQLPDRLLSSGDEPAEPSQAAEAPRPSPTKLSVSMSTYLFGASNITGVDNAPTEASFADSASAILEGLLAEPVAHDRPGSPTSPRRPAVRMSIGLPGAPDSPIRVLRQRRSMQEHDVALPRCRAAATAPKDAGRDVPGEGFGSEASCSSILEEKRSIRSVVSTASRAGRLRSALGSALLRKRTPTDLEADVPRIAPQVVVTPAHTPPVETKRDAPEAPRPAQPVKGQGKAAPAPQLRPPAQGSTLRGRRALQPLTLQGGGSGATVATS